MSRCGSFFLCLFWCRLRSCARCPGPLPVRRRKPKALTESIAALITELDQNFDAMNSLMILRHGKVTPNVGGRRTPPKRRTLLIRSRRVYFRPPSVLHVNEGKLSLDDKVIDYFPDEVPADASENLKI